MRKDAEKKRETGRSFGQAADAYRDSEVHRRGSDLDRLADWCGGADRALDVATGAGHTAGALGRVGISDVVASDVSPAMVQTATHEYDGLGGVVADAESLPFDDAAFDAVTCRIAAHHFPGPVGFVNEVGRVLTPGGTFALADNVAPEDDDLAAFINRVDALRDPTHVEAYPRSQWETWLSEAGFRLERTETVEKRLAFDPWVDRLSPSPEVRARVESLLAEADDAAKTHFEIETADGSVESFTHRAALIRAQKPA